MDNNYNMQQNNMQQPVYQQMPQQPMYQQMPQQPMEQVTYEPPVEQPMEQVAYEQPVYQQPMEQVTYEQPMYQQPMEQPVNQKPKKKKKGFVIGIIAASVALVAVIVTIVLVLVLGGKDITGTWEAKDGTQVIFEDDGKGAFVLGALNSTFDWEKNDNKLNITLEGEKEKVTIVEISKDKLILKFESGEKKTYTRKK